MKFSCERDALINEIAVAQEIISSRNSLSILSNVFLDAKDNTLLLVATDLKVSFETRIPVEVKEAGTTTVFCDKLLGILRSLPNGLIEFENTADGRFIIRPVFKKIDFRLKSISAEKFPELQTIGEDKLSKIPQKALIEMITQTVFAVSDDETRYFMNGVLFEKEGENLIMVATDGRRLSYISKAIGSAVPDFRGVIIPPKVLTLFRKQASGEGDLEFAITDKQIFLVFDNQKLSSSLIDGQFPNHKRVIPEQQTYSIVVDRAELTEALKRIALMVEKSKRVFVNLTENAMTLQSEETEIGHGSEELFCDYQGPENKLALNVQYLSDPLRVLEDEKVSIRYTETNKAISLFPVPDRDYFHIIMPMSFD